MVVLPDGGLENEIVHASIPRFFIGKLDLLGSDIERCKIVALGRLDFERRCMRSDVRGNVTNRLLRSLAQLGRVGGESIKFHDDGNRDDDGPSK